MSSGEVAILVAELFLRAKILIQIIAIAWTVWLTDVVFLGKALSNHLGIRPRTLGGLLGVGFAPLLHGSIDHLTGNTVPFFILGGRILLNGVDNFVIVTVATMLSSGFGEWLFGESKVNGIGASGVVFGYLGFLLLRGYYDHEVITALASLIVCFFYGRYLWGIFPMPEQEQRLGVKIGWDAHLFGLLGGAATARFLEAIKLALPEGLLS